MRYTNQVVVTVTELVRSRIERLHKGSGDSRAEVLRRCIDAGIEQIEREYAARAKREAKLAKLSDVAS